MMHYKGEYNGKEDANLDGRRVKVWLQGCESRGVERQVLTRIHEVLCKLICHQGHIYTGKSRL